MFLGEEAALPLEVDGISHGREGGRGWETSPAAGPGDGVQLPGQRPQLV